MFEKGAILFFYCEAPVHAGSGSSLSIVDLPVQRERITNLPIIQASSLKGVLREELERVEEVRMNDQGKAQQITKALFGPETKRAREHAGCISPHDARVLLFPVRSLAGIFAWTTCPFVLERFKREATMMGVEISWQVPKLSVSSDEALVAPGCEISVNGTVVLEEFAFRAKEDREVGEKIAPWLKEKAFPETSDYQYWRERFPKSFVVLPDDAFRDFAQMATEVISRIRIAQDTKTVEERALWTEEHLPSETLLYAPLLVGKPLAEKDEVPDDLKDNGQPSAQKVLELLKELMTFKDGQVYLDRLQVGGDETVGRGVVKVRFLCGNTEGR